MFSVRRFRTKLRYTAILVSISFLSFWVYTIPERYEEQSGKYSVQHFFEPPLPIDQPVKPPDVSRDAAESTINPLHQFIRFFEDPESKVNGHNLVNATWINEMLTEKKPGHMKVEKLNTFILSAFVKNSTKKAEWDVFTLNVWEDKTFENNSYKCCFLFDDMNIENNYSERKIAFYIKAALHAKEILCNRENISDAHIKGIALAKGDQLCPSDADSYLILKYLYQPVKKSLGVCGKVVHASKDPFELVAWFEVLKMYGVSKVLIYPLSNLNEKAIKVLRYYELEGLVEIVPFYTVPMKAEHQREFSTVGSGMKFNDLQVMVYDCEERLREYRYAILMDTDEYIVPTDKDINSYVQLMDVLLSKRLNNAGFMFWDHIYFTSWGIMNNNSELTLGKYFNRTTEIMDRPKMIFIPERVRQGSLQIHGLSAIPGFRSTNYVPKEKGVLKHYRKCREEWKLEKCMKNMTRITDTSMIEVEQKILPNYKMVQNILGL